MTTSSFNGWTLRTNTVTSAADSTSNTFSFAWFGNDTGTTGTWDFAPLDEFSESEPERFQQWRNRIDTDPTYRRQQLRMNQLHDRWYDTWTSSGTSNSFTMQFDATTITNDFSYHPRFRPLPRLTRLKNYLNKFLKLNRTGEEIQQEKAEKKSWELVKDWLTKEEFAELTSKGELEVQSQKDKETIYIIKRDPIATVEKRKDGNFEKRMCVIPKESGLPTGDAFLSKFMLLKQDEEEFEKIAIVRESA